jgi:hypothetical protein
MINPDLKDRNKTCNARQVQGASHTAQADALLHERISTAPFLCLNGLVLSQNPASDGGSVEISLERRRSSDGTGPSLAAGNGSCNFR